MDLNFLTSTPLFSGTDVEEIKIMLECMDAKEKEYHKGNIIFSSGETIHELGLVLSGGISIENYDVWGNKTIIDFIGPGQIFAETYACVPGAELLVDVYASQDSSILLLDVGKVLRVCSNVCSHHTQLIRNLLAISSQKNMNLIRRSFHTAPKSIRGRLMSFLSYQAKKQGKFDFYIPFNRQQLADYLNVDRSALSNELGKMHKDGYLTVEKNHFILSEQIIEE